MKLLYKEVKAIQNKYCSNINFSVFLETGTHKGCTIFAMEPYFEELHTIEVSEFFYTQTKKNYSNNKINFYLGDSVKELPTILQKIKNKPTIFFLDAHWSCGKTEFCDKEVPVLEELKIIDQNYNNDCIIIIDDYRLFNTNNDVDWSEISEQAILNSIDTNKIVYSYAENDRFILIVKSV